MYTYLSYFLTEIERRPPRIEYFLQNLISCNRFVIKAIYYDKRTLLYIHVFSSLQIVCCAVILSADGVKKQAKCLSETCHKLENRCESCRTRKELLKFIKLLSAKTPQFSAAGFFNIDRTTLFSILSASTTYYVALVQYNQSNL